MSEPISLDINFCEGCLDTMTIRCKRCIRVHLNEALNCNEDYWDNWRGPEPFRRLTTRELVAELEEIVKRLKKMVGV